MTCWKILMRTACGPRLFLFAELHFDGKHTATLPYEDLVITVDTKPSPDGTGRVPVATGQYLGQLVFSLQPDENGQDEPAADVRVMRIDPATRIPQVVLSYFWGGAHCCTVTKIATIDASARWHVMDAGALDSDGYEFKDLDGDGGVELISVDNNFLYAFEAYAGSFAPTRITKLVGPKLKDVTRDAEYKTFLRQRLDEMEAAAPRRGAGRDQAGAKNHFGLQAKSSLLHR
jgi:hypothetical protein